jgi:hypothetical protein
MAKKKIEISLATNEDGNDRYEVSVVEDLGDDGAGDIDGDRLDDEDYATEAEALTAAKTWLTEQVLAVGAQIKALSEAKVTLKLPGGEEVEKVIPVEQLAGIRTLLGF